MHTSCGKGYKSLNRVYSKFELFLGDEWQTDFGQTLLNRLEHPDQQLEKKKPLLHNVIVNSLISGQSHTDILDC